MSENYLGIMTENYEWELSSENYDKERIITQYITLHGTLHGKVEIYRDTGVSKNIVSKQGNIMYNLTDNHSFTN